MAGCAAYKELEPVPRISFLEAGYIELLDDDEKFELDEGNKYFIRFPQPTQENIYLVLNFKDKSPITSYLTRAFDDGEGTIIKLTDELQRLQIPSKSTTDLLFELFTEQSYVFMDDLSFNIILIAILSGNL